MKKALVCGLSAMLAFNSMCVFASSDAQYEALKFDNNTKAVEIADVVLGADGELVSVSIANQAKGTEFSKTNTPDIFNAYILNSEGKIGQDIVFSEKLLSGRYNIFVNGSFGQKNYYTIYRNETDEATINLIAQINSASTSDAIKTIVYTGSNMEILGIDRENAELSAYLEGYCDVSKDTRTALGGKFTPASFYDCFIDYVVCEMLAAGEIDSALQKYAELFGTTYEEYSNLDSAIKAFADSVLEKTKFITYQNNKPTLTDLEKTYGDACLLAEILNSDKWSTMQSVILENKDALELDMSDYDDIKDSLKYKVFTAMCDARDDFESLADVKKSFEKNSTKVEASQSDKKESSSSGSSSGSSKLPSFSADSGFVPPAPQTPAQTQPAFSDISGHYSEEYVLHMANSSVINGYADGTFRPDANVTRAEFAKIICGLFSIEAGSESVSFADVDANDWYYEYVTKLASAGIITGYDGNFNPNANITRQDAALISYRVLKALGQTTDGSASFDDSALVSEYAKDAVAALAANGVIKGSDNKFAPQNNITRGDSAIMLSRLYDLYSGK